MQIEDMNEEQLTDFVRIYMERIFEINQGTYHFQNDNFDQTTFDRRVRLLISGIRRLNMNIEFSEFLFYLNKRDGFKRHCGSFFSESGTFFEVGKIGEKWMLREDGTTIKSFKDEKEAHIEWERTFGFGRKR